LLQNTLWPEVQKLYGHGYEVFSVAVDVKSGVIASACKATKAEHAKIILWQRVVDASSQKSFYKQFDTLKGHELTVVQMKFSHDGNYLLSVSRDRSWKLFKRNADGDSFALTRAINAKNTFHTRIIWSCDWSHDDAYFVTTSRDKRACIWPGIGEESSQNLDCKPARCGDSKECYLELSDSITACSFAPAFTSDNKRFIFVLLDIPYYKILYLDTIIL
jgi:elongator complex protein 2